MVYGPGDPRAPRPVPVPPAGQGYAGYGVGVPSGAPTAQYAAGVRQAAPAAAGAPVTLHIYDVSNKKRVRFVNNVLSMMGSGAYHAAVEVYGREWSFGYKASGSGLFSTTPGGCQAHHYRKPIPMGNTECTEDQVYDILQEMSAKWRGKDYNLLRHNCTHFSDTFCQALGLQGLPRWVMSLAASGTRLEDINHIGYEARSGSPQGHTGYGDLPRGLLEMGRARREEEGGWAMFDFARGCRTLCGCE